MTPPHSDALSHGAVAADERGREPPRAGRLSARRRRNTSPASLETRMRSLPATVLAFAVALLSTARPCFADHAQAEKIAVEARKAFSAGNPQTAEELWGQAMAADPTFGDWVADRGAV